MEHGNYYSSIRLYYGSLLQDSGDVMGNKPKRVVLGTGYLFYDTRMITLMPKKWERMTIKDHFINIPRRIKKYAKDGKEKRIRLIAELINDK